MVKTHNNLKKRGVKMSAGADGEREKREGGQRSLLGHLVMLKAARESPGPGRSVPPPRVAISLPTWVKKKENKSPWDLPVQERKSILLILLEKISNQLLTSEGEDERTNGKGSLCISRIHGKFPRR